MLHFIRMGTHAEKEYLLKAHAWYDELLVNANLLEGTASATSYLAHELTRRFNKAYFIDPVTYSFALNPAHMKAADVRGQEHFKRTFLGLAERYGLIEPGTGEIHQLLPDLFAEDPALRRAFCQAVIRYQQTRCEEALQADSAFLGEPHEVRPSRLMAPYFSLSEDPRWEATAADLVREAGEYAHSEYHRGVWAVLCFDGRLLEQPHYTEMLVDTFGQLACEGYCLWATDFDEHRATPRQLAGLRDLVRRLTESGRPVTNLYGGYLSLLLARDGMYGFSHGVGYGEHRNIVPVVGGGLPPAKYYLRAIHDHIYLDEMLRMAQGLSEKEFTERVCGCIICRGLLEGGIDALVHEYSATVRKPFGSGFRDFPAPGVYRLTRFHFLHNRHLEVREAATADPGDLIVQLQSAHDDFASQLGHGRLLYLQAWKEALESS